MCLFNQENGGAYGNQVQNVVIVLVMTSFPWHVVYQTSCLRLTRTCSPWFSTCSVPLRCRMAQPGRVWGADHARPQNTSDLSVIRTPVAVSHHSLKGLRNFAWTEEHLNSEKVNLALNDLHATTNFKSNHFTHFDNQQSISINRLTSMNIQFTRFFLCFPWDFPGFS